MWLLVERSEDRELIPLYEIIQKKYVLEKENLQYGKFIHIRDKRSKKKKHARILMLSESKRQLKEHKKKLQKRAQQAKTILSKCMRNCRKKTKKKVVPEPELVDCLPGPSKICMLRIPRIPNIPTSPSSSSTSSSTPSPVTVHDTSTSSTTSTSSGESRTRAKHHMPAPAPPVDRSRSRSPHASRSRNPSVCRRDRRLSRHQIPLLRSRSMVCSTPISSIKNIAPKITFEQATQTDPTPSTPLHKPTVAFFSLFIKQLYSHFLKLVEQIDELKANRDGNESLRQNALDSSDSSSDSDIIQISDSEDLPHQHLIDILKGLNVNVQVLGANAQDLEKNAQKSNENAQELDQSSEDSDDCESDENAQDSDESAQRSDENLHDSDENALESDENEEDSDNNDPVADENDQIADVNDQLVVENDQVADNNDADADMHEWEDNNHDPDEDMQVLNVNVPAAADNAQNVDGNPPIFDENIPVLPVFGELRQPPVFAEPMQPLVFAEPMQPPVFAEPMQPPVFAEPRQPPVFAQPMQPPIFVEPRQLPAFGEPRQPPVFVEPRQPPVFAQPRQSSPKPKKLEVRRVSAQSTVHGEPSNLAQRCIYGDEDMVAIGSNRTLIPRRLMNDINWTTYTTATRQLLQAVFPRRVLATHSLSGKPSPAFAHHPRKQRLDPRIVDDIVETVRDRCGAERQWVRGVITTKCTDEARLYRNRQNQNNRNDENQENRDPEAGPAPRPARPGLPLDNNSSSSSD